MADTVIDYRFKARGGTYSALYTVNEVPLARELVFETDRLKAKLGNGLDRYNDLPYVIGSAAGQVAIAADFYGAGADLVPGAYCEVFVPAGFSPRRVTLLSGDTGSLELDIRAAVFAAYPPTGPDSICSVSPPKLVAASKMQDATLSGWVSDIPAGSIIRFIVVSCSGITRATLTLEGDKT
ncbi:MAG: hypothetical protein ACOH1V_02265 [Stenotrophomonas sp.]